MNELLKEQVSEIIRREMEFEQGILVSVLSASTSPDLHYAKIFVSILPDEKTEYALSILNNSVKLIQKELAPKLNMKFTPKLHFVLDDTERKASEIDELLDNLEY